MHTVAHPILFPATSVRLCSCIHRHNRSNQRAGEPVATEGYVVYLGNLPSVHYICSLYISFSPASSLCRPPPRFIESEPSGQQANRLLEKLTPITPQPRVPPAHYCTPRQTGPSALQGNTTSYFEVCIGRTNAHTPCSLCCRSHQKGRSEGAGGVKGLGWRSAKVLSCRAEVLRVTAAYGHLSVPSLAESYAHANKQGHPRCWRNRGFSCFVVACLAYPFSASGRPQLATSFCFTSKRPSCTISIWFIIPRTPTFTRSRLRYHLCI